MSNADTDAVRETELLERIYRERPVDEIPWCHPEPPDQLVELVESRWARPCRTVEIGCGAGFSAVWLATRGFEVTGLDVAPSAVVLARQLAERRAVACAFEVADLTEPIVHHDGQFDLAVDWEVLHHIAPRFRARYVANVHRMLKPNGRYASWTFSIDDRFGHGEASVRVTPLGTTLYLSSLEELTELYDPLFEIEELRPVAIRGSRAPHEAIAARLHRKDVAIR